MQPREDQAIPQRSCPDTNPHPKAIPAWPGSELRTLRPASHHAGCTPVGRQDFSLAFQLGHLPWVKGSPMSPLVPKGTDPREARSPSQQVLHRAPAAVCQPSRGAGVTDASFLFLSLA